MEDESLDDRPFRGIFPWETNQETTMSRRRLALLSMCTLALLGCRQSTAAEAEANKDLVRQFIAAVNAADWNGLDSLMTQDFQRHSAATTEMPEITSLEQFKQMQQASLAGIPDQRVTVRSLTAEGDRVAVNAVYSGTNTGAMGDIPATGKAVRLPFLGVLRIANGKIAEMWVEWDNVAMLSQLGLFPPRGPSTGT